MDCATTCITIAVPMTGYTAAAWRSRRRGNTPRKKGLPMTRIGHGLAMLAAGGALLAAACQPVEPPPADADVIVIGAGVAGLAAALEAESLGARVLVIEANSVAGGHAVKAQGLAIVDTPLQRSRGITDSPDKAYRDLMAWGEGADAWWVRRYTEESGEQVYAWLTGLGVRFDTLSAASQASVPRLHATRGGATGVVVPMIAEALRRPGISFLWSTEATGLLRRDGRVRGVYTEHGRTGSQRLYRAEAVILASGGYEGNLELVRRSWRRGQELPGRLLVGAGRYATGSGLRLAEPYGAATSRLDRQDISIDGLPDPRWPGHGLLASNPAAIRVDAAGRRFTNEAASGKVLVRSALGLSPATHWLVFDAVGARQLHISGASWLAGANLQHDILDNPELVRKADSIEALAAAAGLPPAALAETVQRFNRFVDQGMDTDFGRIGPGTNGARPPALRRAPFYAMQLYPMTRASMGGLDIDHEARVLGGAGQVIQGLFAAGEATGVAGINGSHGGEGTFLGPSILLGRMAARQAVALVSAVRNPAEAAPTAAAPAGATAAQAPPLPAAALPELLARQRRGYWHFGVSHALVVERSEPCGDCHREGWDTTPAGDREQQLVQLASCTRCH